MTLHPSNAPMGNYIQDHDVSNFAFRVFIPHLIYNLYIDSIKQCLLSYRQLLILGHYNFITLLKFHRLLQKSTILQYVKAIYGDCDLSLIIFHFITLKSQY